MINLNVHSGYDFLSSSIKIDELLSKVAADNQRAVAISDRNTMHAHYLFLSLAPKYNIKPIIAMEISVQNEEEIYHIIAYAKNNTGYRSLIRLSTMFSYKQIDDLTESMVIDLLTECLVVCPSLASLNLAEQLNIDDDDIYQSHMLEHEAYRKVVVRPAFYLNREDKPVLNVLHAIRDNTRVDVASLSDEHGEDFVRTFNDLTELEQSYLKNHESMVLKCDVDIPKVSETLPTFKNDMNMDSKSYLWHILAASLIENTPNSEVYQQRLKYEYDVICDMHYEDYFLIVEDAVRFAKDSGIIVGPGRGSSSASLVAYLLNITEIDPIKYDLVFERFLNPERVSMPDIDIDFEDERRNEVIDYLIQSYGEMNVAHISNIARLSLKAATRNVGRVLDFSSDELSYLSNLVTEVSARSDTQVFESKEYENLIAVDEKYVTLKALVAKIEMLPSHPVIHASGILLSKQALTTDIPVTFARESNRRYLMSQWPMEQVEAVGLLKIDILILKTLTNIKYMVRDIQRKNPAFSLADIDIETHDSRVYNLFSSGLTMGIFQFESQGIREALRRVKPQKFLELVAMVSLYRPGPMDSINTYTRGKNNPHNIEYLHPNLKDILELTYGVIIYQEQIMQIAVLVAGFSYGEADILRRAMGKKDQQTLLSMRGKFIEGALKNGYDHAFAEQMYDYIQKFEAYGFVKSHGVSYSKISYWMAHIKLYYRHVFFANMLTYHSKDVQKLTDLVKEMNTYKIKIEPPCINKSRAYHTTDNNIRIGLSFIKGVNAALAKEIVNERQLSGAYEDIYDLKNRIDGKKLNKNALLGLIKSGALDIFGNTRKTLLQMSANIAETDDDYTHHSFLSDMGFEFKTAKEESEMATIDLLEFEKEVLGFYVSEHPIHKLKRELSFLAPHSLDGQHREGAFLIYLSNVRKIKTKKNQDMAFLSVSDGNVDMDGVLFPDAYAEAFHLLKEQILIARGQIKLRNDVEQIVINNLMTVDEYIDNKIKNTKLIYIRNINQYNVINRLENTGVPVIDFERNTSLGSIHRDNIRLLIEAIEPSDIRLME